MYFEKQVLVLAVLLSVVSADLREFEKEFGISHTEEEKLMYELGMKKRIVTYNADLTPSHCTPDEVPEFHVTQCPYDERRDLQIKVINRDQFRVEFMCMQGVWFRKDAITIIEKTKSLYPHSYSFIHKDDQVSGSFVAPCTEFDGMIIEFLSICEYNMCYTYDSIGERFACIEEKCGIDILRTLSADCVSCFFLGTPRNPAVECLKSEYALNPTGLLILSKAGLGERKQSLYSSNSHELVRRGFLDVEVSGIGRIVCTQLTEKLGKQYVELTNEFDSYAAKNQFELEKLLRYVKDIPKVIIAGDLGISMPTYRGGKIAEQFALRYPKIQFEGFKDPVYDHYEFVPVPCSVCFGNPMIPKYYLDGNDGLDGFVFDHILLRGFNVSKMIINEKLNADTFRVFEETYGNNHPLSSHYGELLTLLFDVDVQVPVDDKVISVK